MNIKYYLTINAKILLAHFQAQLISCFIGLFAFSYFISYDWGKLLAFVFYTGFYIVSMYSKAYKIGERETKSYSEHKPYPLKGLAACILTLAVCLISVLLYLFGDALRGENGLLYIILLNIFRFWSFNLSPMFNLAEGIGALWYVLVFLIPTASVFFGYLAGIKRFELGYKFFSKLVYKDKK